MTLGLSPAQLNAAQGPHRVVVPLVEMYFGSGTLYLTPARWDIVIGAVTYVHAPLQFPKARESDQSNEGLQVSLNGLDPAIITLMTAEPYQGRLFRLLKCFLQPDSNSVIGTPVQKFIGRMRNMTGVEDNAKAAVTLFVEHYEGELATASPLRWTDADQKRLYPDDRGCEYAAENSEKTVIWPSKNAQQYGVNPIAPRIPLRGGG